MRQKPVVPRHLLVPLKGPLTFKVSANLRPKEPDEVTPCDHGVTFDEEAARKILEAAPTAKNAVDFVTGPVDQTAEVRRRWPRGWFTDEKPCPKCGHVGIVYASPAHYALGDW